MGSRRKRKKKPWGARTLIPLAAAGLAVAGARCGLDRGLKELGLNREGQSAPSSPTNRTGSATPTGKAGSATPTGKAGSAPPTGTTVSAPAPTRGTERPRAPAVSEHLELGVPVRAGSQATRTDASAPDDHLMIKPQYALSYNRSRNVANWVSWKLDGSWFGDAPRHRGRFLVDNTLPEGWYRVQHDDYTNSGFDRGHMVRSEERTRTPEDNRATFLMTNVLPQRHELNAGPWLKLEDACQRLAQKEGRTLHVVAGGVFGARPAILGKGVAVPEAFFKIAVVLDRGQGVADIGPSTRVIAVLAPNEDGVQDEGWERYRTTVDEIERRTGYDFLTAIPEAVQRVIEARVDNGSPPGRSSP